MLRASTYQPHRPQFLSQGDWPGQDWVTLGCLVPAHPSPLPPTLTPFTDELQKLLLEQMELRKKLEREFQSLKGTPIPTHLTSPLLRLMARTFFPRSWPPSGTPFQAAALRARRKPLNSPFQGVPATPKTEGVGRE